MWQLLFWQWINNVGFYLVTLSIFFGDPININLLKITITTPSFLRFFLKANFMLFDLFYIFIFNIVTNIYKNAILFLLCIFLNILFSSFSPQNHKINVIFFYNYQWKHRYQQKMETTNKSNTTLNLFHLRKYFFHSIINIKNTTIFI